MSISEIADNRYEVESTKAPIITVGGVMQIGLMVLFCGFFGYMIVNAARGAFMGGGETTAEKQIKKKSTAPAPAAKPAASGSAAAAEAKTPEAAPAADSANAGAPAPAADAAAPAPAADAAAPPAGGAAAAPAGGG